MHSAFRIPFSTFWMLSSRYLTRRRLRTLLVVASIALGVATLVATRALNDSLIKSAQGATTPWAGVTDLLVQNGQVGVAGSVVNKIRAAELAEIKDVLPVVYSRVTIPELGNRSVLLLGIDEAAAEKSRENPWGVAVEWHDPAAGLWSLATGARPALVGLGLSEELARKLVEKKHDFRIRNAGQEQRVRSVGTVRLEGAAAPLGNNVLFLRVADAAELAFPRKPGQITQVNLTLRSGADKEKTRQRLQTLLGDEVEVRTAEANDKSVRDVTGGLELGFAIGGTGALIVGLFLVYNALAVSVAERRHDIGVLRSLGATRSLIAGLFVAEAGVLGLVGSLLGLPLGLVLAHAGLGPLGGLVNEMFIQMEAQAIEPSRLMMSLAVTAGVVTSLLAALVPALQAATEQPADAVRRVPISAKGIYRILQVGVIALLLGAGVLCVAWRERLPIRFGAFGGIVCILLAALVTTPLLTGLLGRLLQPLFRYVFGLEGRLAADNLARAPGRTGLVIGALAATTALLVQTAGFIHSTEAAVFDWIDRQVAADLFVTSGSVASSTGMALPMEESLGPRLKSLPEVAAVLPVRFHRLDFRDRIVVLVAVDTKAFQGSGEDHALARNMARFPRLSEPGTVLVSENFAFLYKVAPGDRINIRGRRGPVEVEVIGTTVDYTWNRGTIIVDRAWFREEFADDLVDVYDIYLKPGADAEAVRQVIRERWADQDALFVLKRDELRRDVARVLQRAYALAYAQQAVVGVVAMLGVVSALLISVLQRRRELGLLRAVGATREQILRSVLAEAVLMGVIGGAIGVGTGVLLEWYTVSIMLPDEAGFIFPMRIPWTAACVVVGLSVLLATLAGLGPALHAMRIRIAEAIAYE